MKYFYTIAQCESLSKAAEKLHTSQPTLSRSLRAFEDELGTTLFDRVGRSIVLNDAGRVALGRVISVLNSADALKRDVDNFVYDQSLSLDFYVPVPMGDTEQVVADFKRKYPTVRIRMASYPSELLKNIQPNVTFFASTIVHKARNYLQLGEEEIVVSVSKNHPLAKKKSVRLADLANEQFARPLPSALYDITDQMFFEAGFRPNTVIEDQDFNRILSFVANDFAIALTPSITWFRQGWKDQLATIPISDVRKKRYLYLKWPENETMNWATLRFREFVVEHFNKEHGFSCKI